MQLNGLPHFRTQNACVSADTQRGTERKPVPLTQRAVIVSVHRASCQREGERKSLGGGWAHRCRALSLGEEKNQGEAVRSAKSRGREGGREAVSALQTFYRGLDGQMSASAHFNDSITANSLKQEKEASRDRDLGVRLTEKTLLE